MGLIQDLDVLYASTSLGGNDGFEMLQLAINALLKSAEATPPPTLMWSIQYEQRTGAGQAALPTQVGGHTVFFPPLPLDLATVDSVLEHVKQAWQRILADEAAEFLVFADRETYDDDE